MAQTNQIPGWRELVALRYPGSATSNGTRTSVTTARPSAQAPRAPGDMSRPVLGQRIEVGFGGMQASCAAALEPFFQSFNRTCGSSWCILAGLFQRAAL